MYKNTRGSRIKLFTTAAATTWAIHADHDDENAWGWAPPFLPQHGNNLI